jgi:hypothetical protein
MFKINALIKTVTNEIKTVNMTLLELGKEINFEKHHSRCVSTKSNYKVYVYIVKHNYILGGMLFAICKAQLHDSPTNVGHLQVVQ